jgi:hypothetical protein
MNLTNDENKTLLNKNITKTSTPLNEDNIIKNPEFHFISPPNCIINSQECGIRRINSRHIEDEIKIKETYIRQLKSIDLAKYSFPNE